MRIYKGDDLIRLHRLIKTVTIILALYFLVFLLSFFDFSISKGKISEDFYQRVGEDVEILYRGKDEDLSRYVIGFQKKDQLGLAFYERGFNLFYRLDELKIADKEESEILMDKERGQVHQLIFLSKDSPFEELKYLKLEEEKSLIVTQPVTLKTLGKTREIKDITLVGKKDQKPLEITTEYSYRERGKKESKMISYLVLGIVFMILVLSKHFLTYGLWQK